MEIAKRSQSEETRALFVYGKKCTYYWECGEVIEVMEGDEYRRLENNTSEKYECMKIVPIIS